MEAEPGKRLRSEEPCERIIKKKDQDNIMYTTRWIGYSENSEEARTETATRELELCHVFYSGVRRITSLENLAKLFDSFTSANSSESVIYLVGFNAPWTRRIAPAFPKIRIIEQSCLGGVSSPCVLPAKYRVESIFINCYALEDVVECCKIRTPLPCIQAWCGGAKYFEGKWSSTSSTKNEDTGKNVKVSSFIPSPLRLPFQVPLSNATVKDQDNSSTAPHPITPGLKLHPYYVLVISAPWCPPCKVLKPHLPILEKEYTEYAHFVYCHYDHYPYVRTHYDVSKIPTIVVINTSDGSCVGNMQHSDPSRLRTFLDKTMNIFRLIEDF